MKIGVSKEILEGERRVGLIPESVKKLISKGFTIAVEKGAGESAHFTDDEYIEAGATLVDSAALAGCDIICRVRHPSTDSEIQNLKDGALLFAILDPIQNISSLDKLGAKKISAFAMEFIPRTTLAQSMDVLSSMATIAGYKAVLLAAYEFGKFFPMLMTAAGTIQPARVLILGAGVAGLQAIASARRLGAIVEVFDVRPAVKEQVESLGGKFVEMEIDASMQDEQGYAKEATPEFLAKQKELVRKHLAKSDICITTAQVFGKKAPVLVTEDMVKGMKGGSVIVDLAVETGGNVELSKPGETVRVNDVKIIGPVNLTSSMANSASRMYSKNLENLITYLWKDNQLNLKDDDEIVNRTRVLKDGELVSQIVKTSVGR
ncbi:MAG: Re/Si-specific NAD(P)(+) transhydrogenase subunit alpha [Leptospiraceae bacterium]|nr:Re/Si-specific NAD(P)(+) transhydrogenase subunit alpha [Leptospiraceae bacterium]MCB1200611.1 Re/Si-specific NAD(P)(+) transhydrogenase subunit alpha [Leptospiraceae bacterium]